VSVDKCESFCIYNEATIFSESIKLNAYNLTGNNETDWSNKSSIAGSYDAKGNNVTNFAILDDILVLAYPGSKEI